MSFSPNKTPWAIILCKFPDVSDEPHKDDKTWFEDAFTDVGKGKGGLFDYFFDVSYEKHSLAGSKVFGWFTMDLKFTYTSKQSGKTFTKPVTYKNDLEWRQIKDDIGFGRMNRISWGLETAAANGVKLSNFYGAVVILNAATEYGGFLGPEAVKVGGEELKLALVILDPSSGSMQHRVIAHELAHGFNLKHSRRYKGTWSNIVWDYEDPYDVMSAEDNIKSFEHKRWSWSGPGLNAVWLRQLGWLPDDDDHLAKVDDKPQSVKLAPLSEPNAPGVLAVQAGYKSIPVYVGPAGKVPSGYWQGSPDWRPGHYLVEYRHKSRWDEGILKDCVLVHLATNDYQYSYVVEGPKGNLELFEGDSFYDINQNLLIEVVKIDPKIPVAVVEFGPMPSVYIDTKVETISSTVKSKGVYEYPGIPKHCPPKKFKFEERLQEQRAILKAQLYRMSPATPYVWSVMGTSVAFTGQTGQIILPVKAYFPDLSGKTPSPYKAVQIDAVISFKIMEDTIELRNRPEDGIYSFPVIVGVTDNLGFSRTDITAVQFKGDVLEFEPGYDEYTSECLRSAIFDHLREITKTVPVEGIPRPSPVAWLGDEAINPILSSIEYLADTTSALRVAADHVFGPWHTERLTFPTLTQRIRWVDRRRAKKRGRNV